jgi:hypothetical protein
MATVAQVDDGMDEVVEVDAGPIAAAADPAYSEPSLLDHHRYWANRAGQSVAELATSEKVTEEVVAASLLRVRNDNERYSSLGAGVEVRKLLFQSLPKIRLAIDEALGATRLEGKEVIIFDRETGKAETTKEPVERPDHDTRLRAIDGVRTLLSVVQPKDPAVQIVSNSQTNILNQAALPAGEGHTGLTSPEAVIRMIQNQRTHALTDGRPASLASQPATLEALKEDSPMPRVRKNDLEEDELLTEPEDVDDTVGEDEDDIDEDDIDEVGVATDDDEEDS